MNRFLLLALLLAGLQLGACSSPTANDSATAEAPATSQPASIESDLAESKADGGASRSVTQFTPPSSRGNAPVSAAPAPNRLLVYHADLRVKVTDMPAAAARLEAAVQATGGWMSGQTETRENGESRQQTIIRVTPERFGQLLKTLSGLGTVESKALSTADVTVEHADVTARLAAKRAMEQEYLRLLKQGKKISDLLEVQERLGQVREEIEATEARLKKLNDEVGFSTITVVLYQPLALDTPDAPVVSVGSRLVEAVYDGWRLIVGLVIGAVTVWPLWLLGGAGWWLVRRRRK